jgi:hypothetical protein
VARKESAKPKRLVWRISDRAPLGEWVDPNIPPEAPKKAPPEPSHGSWTRSSFDLLSGVDVADDPDTVPDDLFDEYFSPANKDKPVPPRE